MRGLQLIDKSEGISKTFANIELLATNCRFRNCKHNGEPDCVIEAAIEDDYLDSESFLQFLKFSHKNAKVRERRASKLESKTVTQQQREDKDNYFKEIHMQLRKNAKDRRKCLKDEEFKNL